MCACVCWITASVLMDHIPHATAHIAAVMSPFPTRNITSFRGRMKLLLCVGPIRSLCISVWYGKPAKGRAFQPTQSQSPALSGGMVLDTLRRFDDGLEDRAYQKKTKKQTPKQIYPCRYNHCCLFFFFFFFFLLVVAAAASGCCCCCCCCCCCRHCCCCFSGGASWVRMAKLRGF
jgi:hypothetical protein